MSIDRSKVEALIKEALNPTIIQDVAEGSTALSLMRRLPNMTSNQTRMPVLDMLPLAYWVNGDTGYKNYTNMGWENVYIDAEELAVIVPIPEAVLADADYDIMEEVKPRVQEAMNLRIDNAILFGQGKPRSWQGDIVTLARNAGNVVQGEPTFDNLMGDNGLISLIEQSGKIPNGYIADIRTRGKLRGIKNDNGDPIYRDGMTGSTTYTLDGAPITFPQNGSFDALQATMIGGAFDQAVYAIRQDVTYKILTEAVIQDPATREIVFNLAQQDMIALRVVMRLGWAVPNPVTALNPDRLNVPFAVLVPETVAPLKKLTFTALDGEDPVQGAVIEVGGMRAKTDASGEAEINVQSGQYRAIVKHKDYFTQELNFAINADMAHTFNLVSKSVQE